MPWNTRKKEQKINMKEERERERGGWRGGKEEAGGMEEKEDALLTTGRIACAFAWLTLSKDISPYEVRERRIYIHRTRKEARKQVRVHAKE